MNQYFDNNDNLDSKLRIIDYKYDQYSFSFYSDLGVFSKDHIDFGSKLLLETYLKNRKDISKCLDVGCGYGFIGISLAKILNIEVDMIDINNRALHLTDKNIKLNKVKAKVFLSDGYTNINNRYDLIITNPPIRAGKQVVYNILFNGKKYLSEKGELWLVMRKDQGAKSAIKDLEKEYLVEIIVKNKGFYVICLKND